MLKRILSIILIIAIISNFGISVTAAASDLLTLEQSTRIAESVSPAFAAAAIFHWPEIDEAALAGNSFRLESVTIELNSGSFHSFGVLNQRGDLQGVVILVDRTTGDVYTTDSGGWRIMRAVSPEGIALHSLQTLVDKRDFLNSTHITRFIASSETWGIDNIVDAVLVDFDNDGIYEMVLVVSTGDGPWNSHAVAITGGRSIRPLSAINTGAVGYEVVHTSNGRAYLLYVESYDWGDLWGSYSLNSSFAFNGEGGFFRHSQSLPTGITQRRQLRDGNAPGTAGREILAEINNRIATATPPAPPIAVQLDGRALAFDVPPQLRDGRTLVPLRAIFEALGAEVDWNAATQTATATRGDTTVVLTIGSQTATINGQSVTMDVPGRVVDGRTLVPLRFVAEAFGVEVNWDSGNRVVTITSQ